MRVFLIMLVLTGLTCSCNNLPSGLDKAKIKAMTVDLIKTNPKYVMQKVYPMQTKGMTDFAIVSVDVSEVKVIGKGMDRELEVWSATFKATGMIAAEGTNGGVYEFEFQDRIQVYQESGKWQTRYR